MKEIFKKFRTIFKFEWQDNLEYRGYTFFWIFTESAHFYVMYFLWTFVYRGQNMVSGYTLSQMVTYYFVIYIIDQFTQVYMEWNLINRIKEGTLLAFLIRPLDHRLYYFSTNIAYKILRVIWATPIVLVMALLFKDYLVGPTSGMFGLFMLAVLLAASINFCLSLLVGYTAFWLERANGLVYFRWSLAYWLSGTLIPLSFFGERVSEVLRFLPFKYIAGFPLEIYLGKLTSTEIVQGFSVGFIWFSGLAVAAFFVYKKGLRRFAAVGN